MVCCLSPKRHYWLVLDQYHPEYEHDVFPSTWKKEQSHRVDQNSIREKESVITDLIMGLYTHWSASLSPYLLAAWVWMWKVAAINLTVPSRPSRHKSTKGLRPIKAVFFLLEHCWWALSAVRREEMYSSEMCLYLMGRTWKHLQLCYKIFWLGMYNQRMVEICKWSKCAPFLEYSN